MGTSVVRTAWLCHSGHPYRHAESDLASVVLLDSSSGYLGQRWKVVERHGSGYEREKVQRYLRGKVNHLGSNLAGDIMHLLVIMKTTSVTIDRQVLISLVSVLVSSIVSSVFGQRCHSQAWLIGRCLRWSLRSLAYAGAAFP